MIIDIIGHRPTLLRQQPGGAQSRFPAQPGSILILGRMVPTSRVLKQGVVFDNNVTNLDWVSNQASAWRNPRTQPGSDHGCPLGRKRSDTWTSTTCRLYRRATIATLFDKRLGE